MKKILVIGIALAILSGCSRGPRPGSEQEQSGLIWETAWIDPQVVAGDARFTLIQASRIDSFQVEPPTAPSVPSLRFDLPPGGCPVTINVVDERYRVVLPLIVKKLGAGYYKISVQPSQLLAHGLPLGSYALQAEYCDIIDNAPFLLR